MVREAPLSTQQAGPSTPQWIRCRGSTDSVWMTDCHRPRRVALQKLCHPDRSIAIGFYQSQRGVEGPASGSAMKTCSYSSPQDFWKTPPYGTQPIAPIDEKSWTPSLRGSNFKYVFLYEINSGRT